MDATESELTIAAICGDGIGNEVVPAAQEVIEATLAADDPTVTWRELDWSCERYLSTGAMMPSDGLDQLAECDAVFLGAVGAPEVPDTVSLWGLLIPIRRRFDQYVNVRPVKLFDGVESPVRMPDGETIDLVVRENSEGEYSEIGGRFGFGDRQIAVQEAIFTRVGIERVAEFAFQLAGERSGVVTSATKSNGILHSMPFWDEVVADVAQRHQDVTVGKRHIDALAAALVREPWAFDVVVASNLFGDILSDLTAALTGSLGLAPSANLDPSGKHPSMFEPVHGSAPDIAGRGVANPIAQVWSGAMMLEHLGCTAASRRIMTAIAEVLSSGEGHTADLGGSATTREVTAALTRIVAGLRP